MFSKFREPVSGLTHLLGAFVSLIGLIFLIVFSVNENSILRIVTVTIFGISLILLYSASSVYHLVKVSEKAIKVYRRIDHSMIYVLIAGSYTPICLIALRKSWGIQMLVLIWSLAIMGILVKNFWFNAPRWLSTAFYIIMGWAAVIVILPLSRVLSPIAMTWLVAGGVSYTIGGLIYGLKWPKITNKYFGFHEIFHLFVLLGSFCHYWLIIKYVLYIN
jgi:hemolysin III